ncbi:hypothetical protein [Hydrogenimonas thermophila]|uniref:Uncharacterized protein n=1 Tax=Hydrogenimonas thermophila TaxID=223786 RepID=A0A1I5UUV1_9BACT|nr:hypothetical protein [Hydrogenimonas thermophila]SFP99084.1 hypothetical protein SAMN05216234_1723 [Hydrogenimonas thermophila]
MKENVLQEKVQRETRLNAAKLVCCLGKIKTVEDIIRFYESIIIVIKPEVIRCCNILGYRYKDMDYVYSLATKQTYKSLLNVRKHIKKFKIEKKYKGTLKFFSFTSVEKSIKWLTQRIISNMRNTTDIRYKSLYIELSEVYSIEDWNCFINIIEDIEKEIILEQFAKFSKKQKIEIAKKIWKESLLDMDLDDEDFKKICDYLNIRISDIFKDTIEAKIKAERTNIGNKQLFLVM